MKKSNSSGQKEVVSRAGVPSGDAGSGKGITVDSSPAREGDAIARRAVASVVDVLKRAAKQITPTIAEEARRLCAGSPAAYGRAIEKIQAESLDALALYPSGLVDAMRISEEKPKQEKARASDRAADATRKRSQARNAKEAVAAVVALLTAARKDGAGITHELIAEAKTLWLNYPDSYELALKKIDDESLDALAVYPSGLVDTMNLRKERQSSKQNQIDELRKDCVKTIAKIAEVRRETACYNSQRKELEKEIAECKARTEAANKKIRDINARPGMATVREIQRIESELAQKASLTKLLMRYANLKGMVSNAPEMIEAFAFVRQFDPTAPETIQELLYENQVEPTPV